MIMNTIHEIFKGPVSWQRTMIQLFFGVQILFPGLPFLLPAQTVSPVNTKLSGVLIASTYLGGSDTELFVTALDQVDVLVHPNGDIYICGATKSNDFPTTSGVFQSLYGGGESETFIARLNPELSTLIAATYLGGSKEDCASSIAVDEDGNICIAGFTTSPDFPTTPGAYDQTYNDVSSGGGDVFISILTPELDELVASTYLGGTLSERFHHFRMAIDTNGNIFVGGGTLSFNFPVTPNAFLTHALDGGNDMFISKLSGDLTDLIASTYFGGLYWDLLTDLLVTPQNQVCICGNTAANNFPLTPGAYDTILNGDQDGFVSILNNNLETLIASTLIGGSETDGLLSISNDPDGNIYLCGMTKSWDFPCTTQAFDSSFNYGFCDGYVSSFNSSLTNLLSSTFFGGGNWDECMEILFDPVLNEVFVTGVTESSDFPVTPGAFNTTSNGDDDAFVSRFTPGLQELIASTYLGGEFYDFGLEMIHSSDSSIYIIGNTASDSFPVTPGAYNTSINGMYDAFISLMDKDLSGFPVGIEAKENLTANPEVVLFQNSPNPIRHQTTISYFLPITENVLLEIHDMVGRKMITLESGLMKNGRHEVSWDVRDDRGRKLEAGLYVITLTTIRNIQTKKTIIL